MKLPPRWTISPTLAVGPGRCGGGYNIEVLIFTAPGRSKCAGVVPTVAHQQEPFTANPKVDMLSKGPNQVQYHLGPEGQRGLSM